MLPEFQKKLIKPKPISKVYFDPQTSGGLIIAVPEEKSAEFRLSQNKLTELCLQRYLPEMRMWT